jgi:WD40 repeat protein
MKKIFFVLSFFTAINCSAQAPELVIPAGHSSDVVATIVTPDNKYLVSSSIDYTTKIWDRNSGRLLYSFPKIADNKKNYVIFKFMFRNNGRELIALGRSVLMIFDFDKFTITKQFFLEQMECAALSSNGQTLFISSSAEQFKASIIKLNLQDFSYKTIHTLSDPDTWDISFPRISLNKEEDKLLCYSKFKGSALIDTSGKELVVYPTEKHIWCFAPGGALLAIQDAGIKSYAVQFLDAQTLQINWETTVQMNSSFTMLYNFQLAEFDARSGKFVMAGQKDFVVLDYINKKVTSPFNSPRGEIRSICFSPVEGDFIIGTSSTNTKAVYLYGYNIINNGTGNNFGDAVLNAWALKAAVKTSTIVLGSFMNYFKQLNIGRNGFTVKNLQLSNSSCEVVGISPDDKTGINVSNELINIYNTESPNIYTSIQTPTQEGGATEIVFSADGKLAAAVGDLEIRIIDIATKKITYRYKNGAYMLLTQELIGTFSKDNTKFVFMGITDKSKYMVTCISTLTGKKLWDREGHIRSFKFTNKNAAIFCIDYYNNEAIWLNAEDGMELNKKSFGDKDIHNAVITDDAKFALLNVKNNIEIWNLETFEKTSELTGHSNNVSYTDLMSNDKYLVSAAADNTIRVWDWKNQKELFRLILFEENEDWVALMPDGRFDASSDVLKKMYYTRGKEIIPLEVVYEQFFTPMLINRLFNGEQFNPLPVDINHIKKAPTVKLTYAAVQRNLEVANDLPTYQNTTGAAEITVTANANDDVVDEIRLFQNGKILNLATRNLIIADDKTSDATKKYTISLLPGQNTIRAVALNTQRTESAPDEMNINYKTSDQQNTTDPVINNLSNVVVSQVDKDATLHLVVVGINAYQNKSLSLNYALADATSFKDEVEKDVKTVISTVKTYFVTDNTADKTGITNALKEVQKNARPQDVFIFYYAGHGVIGKDKEFYLVPTDVSDLKNVQTELENKGIAAKLLQQYAIDIPAQKQLFILDACQSAGAFEAMLSADGNQQKSIAVVARSTGTHWIAASGAQQFSQEFSSLGHGAFTYVLLQALKGEAATNKMITVNGLKNFLQLQVPVLMKKYNGMQQVPASYGFGNDFPVELIK